MQKSGCWVKRIGSILMLVAMGSLMFSVGKKHSVIDASGPINYEVLKEKHAILEDNICTSPKSVYEDVTLCEYLEEDLEFEAKFSKEFNSSAATMEYFAFDFNDDELEDYLVCFSGAAWSGLAGDTVRIYVKEENGSLRKVFGASVRVREPNFENGYAPIAVLNEKTNGYYDVVLPWTENKVRKYNVENGMYEISEQEGYSVNNPYFFRSGITQMEYEGYFLPLSGNEIEQSISLNINKLTATEEGELYALELEQLKPTGDPLDEISMGRRYLGYFYVTEDTIYHKAVQSYNGFTGEMNDEIVKQLGENEKEFLKTCDIVCCEEGTADIADENGYHAYVEAFGERRIFRYYNDYSGGSKEYLTMVWEREKGLVYYKHGSGSMYMHVEFGVSLSECNGLLTEREALDIVFDYLYADEDSLVDVTFYEKDDVIGYKWVRDFNMSDPVYLTQYGSKMTSQEEVYYFFSLASDLYGSSGTYIRTETYNEFAVNRNTGEVIEMRVYQQDGGWSYSEEYLEKVLESKDFR